MAAYKLFGVPLVPHRALLGAGSEAGPDSDGNFPEEDELMADERGQLQTFYKSVSDGHIAYTDPSDYEGLNDEQKANSTFSPFPGYYKDKQRFTFAGLDGEERDHAEELKLGGARGGARKGAASKKEDSNNNNE